MHESSEEFEIQPDPTSDFRAELAALERLKKSP